MYNTALLLVVLAAGAYAQFNCVEDGFYVDPDFCDVYYHCSRGQYERKECPDGLIFDDTLGPRVEQCNYPFIVPCPDNKQQQDPIPSNEHPVPKCPRQNGRFEHEDVTNCGEYYECTNGVGTLRACHEGLYFDEFTGVCDWASKGFRSGCEKKRMVLDDGFSCPNNATQSQQGVPDRDHTLFIHPEDCRQYYICYDGIRPERSGCPDGTVFNDATLVCDDPQFVPGCEDYYAGRTSPVVNLATPNAANAARQPVGQPRPQQ